jgi:hypothetical protein
MAATYTAAPSAAPINGYFIVYDVEGTLSFEPSTRWELSKNIADAGEVFGESCAYGLSVPIALNLNATQVSGAYGEDGYNKAIKFILLAHPGILGIYDVKADRHTISVLGLFTRICLELSARGFKAIASTQGGSHQ